VSGRAGGIRTRDLSVPNRARNQASLLPDVLNFLLDPRGTRFLGPEPSDNSLNPARRIRHPHTTKANCGNTRPFDRVFSFS
jgi:hypothetical protein